MSVAAAALAPARERPARSSRAAYLLMAPGLLWLGVFFLIPLVTMISTSLQTGSFAKGYTLTFAFGNYPDSISNYAAWFGRSFAYAAIATVLALLISYPLAYTLAFKAGRWKTFLLVLVVAPFFVSFLVRTLAWTSILADEGWVVSVFRSLKLLPSGGHLLATPFAVVSGLTYNFLPFMTLPIFASLDRLDTSLVEAAQDLYASSFRAFRKVTLPLSLPGVVAGTLLTFIPAAGDFINAELLGSSSTQMIGNVILSQFLQVLDYPTAAALSVALMVAITALVAVYIRRVGTEELA